MNDTPPDSFTLTPDDAACLDALLECGVGGVVRGDGAAGVVGTEGGLARCLALIAALPEPTVGNDDVAVAATLDRVARARVDDGVRTLAPGDARWLDGVLEQGARGASGALRSVSKSAEAGAVPRVLGLLDVLKPDAGQASASADDALVRRTLAAVEASRQRERFAAQVMQVAEAPSGRGLGVSWRQVVSAAAVFLVGFSLLMPAVQRTRGVAQQQACATNLAAAGMQLNAWAADHKGALPRGPVGDSWLRAGQPDAVTADGRFNSNSAHLYLLIREDYLAPDYLACASNASAHTPRAAGQMDWAAPAAISYSYQNQHGRGPVRLDLARPGLAVLADKNPLFVPRQGRLVFAADTARNAASRQHRGAGQNILRVDGAAGWSEDPAIGRDNVWTRAGHRGGYMGHEAPVDPNRDAFLVP